MKYPYNDSIHDHILTMEANMALLKEFAARYPDAKPFACSSSFAMILFESSAADWVKERFGAEGWKVQGRNVVKVVDGVTVELHMPSKVEELVSL